MNKEEFLENFHNLDPKSLADEICENHPLLAADLLLLVNSELFNFDDEIINFYAIMEFLGLNFITQRIREYCCVKIGKYKKDLLNRYVVQKKSFSNKLNTEINKYLFRK